MYCIRLKNLGALCFVLCTWSFVISAVVLTVQSTKLKVQSTKRYPFASVVPTTIDSIAPNDKYTCCPGSGLVSVRHT